nr:cache domain-containing protein [Anaerobacillus sp. CMMVII]
MVIISHEVRRDEGLVGLVNIVIENTFLNSVAKSINLGKTGYAWIVDQDGRVVAHPDNTIGENRHITELVPINQENIAAFNKEDSIGWLELESNLGEQTFIFYKGIEGSPGWTLLLSINKEEVLGELSSARVKIILFFIMGLILMSIFAFYYATTISKPILELKKVFEKAETGDLNVVADVRVKNEVGAAAKSFNQMLRQIKS